MFNVKVFSALYHIFAARCAAYLSYADKRGYLEIPLEMEAGLAWQHETNHSCRGMNEIADRKRYAK